MFKRTTCRPTTIAALLLAAALLAGCGGEPAPTPTPLRTFTPTPPPTATPKVESLLRKIRPATVIVPSSITAPERA